MKIEQLIVQHLYNKKTVTLENIGIFYLSPNVAIPFENDKDSVMPQNAITFEYNTKAGQDDDLIDFIVQQTRKIKPLATSDLESFTILGRQFMNIGKPLPIEGLGILQKNQLGQFEFIQGNSINARLEPAPALLKEKDKEEIVFTTPNRRRRGDNKTATVAILIIFVLLAAMIIFYFLFKGNKNSQTEQAFTETADSAEINSFQKDITPAVIPTNTDSLTSKPADTGYTFRVVIREYTDKAVADKAFTRFGILGHTVVLYTQDSSIYKMAVPFKSPLADTLRAKDSLLRVLGGKPYIEVQ